MAAIKIIKTDKANCALDLERRYVIWQERLCHHELTIIGVYAPNTGQEDFWEKHAMIIGCIEHQILLLGDCNTVLYPGFDRSGRGQIGVPSVGFSSIVGSLKLHDIWSFSGRHQSFSHNDSSYGGDDSTN